MVGAPNRMFCTIHGGATRPTTRPFHQFSYSLLLPERVTIPAPFRANLVIPSIPDNDMTYPAGKE